MGAGGRSEWENSFVRARTALTAQPGQAPELIDVVDRQARALPAGQERTVALASTHWLRGELELRAGDLDGAGAEVEKALRMIAPIGTPIVLQGDLLKSEGALYAARGNAAAALASFQRAFSVYRQFGEKRLQSIVLQHIAALYSSANDYARAERYYRQANDLFSADKPLSLFLFNNLGTVLIQAEQYPAAERALLRALKLAREIRSPILEARVLGNLTRSQIEEGQIAKAEVTFARALRVLATLNPRETRAIQPQILATGARIAFVKGDLEKAKRLIASSLSGVDARRSSSDFYYAHYNAFMIYEAAGESARALPQLKAAKRLEDESAKVATTTSAALMAARFDYANQELRIAELKAEDANRRTSFLRILFIGASATGLVVAALLSFFLITIRSSRNEVRAANADLAQSNAALGRALAAKTEFLATTSHEIRTPLNGILGMTQVMLADSGLDAQVRDRIEVVHGAGVTMRSLVDDILDVAKMETGNLTLDPAPMDLADTLRGVARLWETQARGKGLGFVLDLTDAPRWIVSDAGRVRQIVFNLLSNALKFTERGEIGLAATASGERLRITVHDTGIGIAADKCEAIFDSFQQADSSTTRRFGGTGLGLTICRNLARALGGDVLVESAEGQGSRFTLDLPLVAAEVPGQTSAEAAERTILVLDRNPIARGMLRALFAARDVTARFVATAEEAAAALEEGGITVLLVDHAAIEGSLAAVEKLAGAAREAGAMIAVLWPQPCEEDLSRLAEAGAGQVVAKPIAAAALVDLLYAEVREKPVDARAGVLVSRAA